MNIAAFRQLWFLNGTTNETNIHPRSRIVLCSLVLPVWQVDPDVAITPRRGTKRSATAALALHKQVALYMRPARHDAQ